MRTLILTVTAVCGFSSLVFGEKLPEGIPGGYGLPEMAVDFQQQVGAAALTAYNHDVRLRATMAAIQQARLDRQRQTLARTQANKEYWDAMAVSLAADPNLAHIPRVETDPNVAWSNAYQKVRDGLITDLPYRIVVNGGFAGGTTVAPPFLATSTHAKSLQGNMDYITWYRDQLDKQCGEKGTQYGAHYFKQLLDSFFETLETAIPPITVSLSGKRELYDIDMKKVDSVLREHLTVMYRFLYSKYKIFREESKAFAPADMALLTALENVFCLFGGKLPPGWQDNLDVRESNSQTGWRKTAHFALLVLKMKADGNSKAAKEQACVIAIPAKPETAPVAPKPESTTAGAEIVVEKDGRIRIVSPAHK